MPLSITRRKVAIAVAVLAVPLAALLIWRLSSEARVRFITGAVLAQAPDPHQQRPLENATVVAEYGGRISKATSDGMGFFRLRLDPPVPFWESVRLRFNHPDYQPFDTVEPANREIRVVRLTPATSAADVNAAEKPTAIANVRVRYTTKATNTVTVASAVRTFDVVNQGNVPCEGQRPCSPDGRWKANLGSITLNTGEENKQFRNARVSCIAGPCPFTSVESDGFSRGGREISVTVRNWSDTVTYLVEAEVMQTMQADLLRHTYPVIFGSTMNFTLPAPAQGPTIEAEVDSAQIVFPLGPKLILSWATCRVEPGSDGAKLYRCELKPGYRFK